MINVFWAVEHLLLALLCFKFYKEDLKEFGYHKITKYWGEAKLIAGTEKAAVMCKFDNYIGDVQSYFNERYPESNDQIKLKYTTAKRVHIKDQDTKRINPKKVYNLQLDQLDHFVNFMLHDITYLGDHVSRDLGYHLERMNNEELYLEKNNFSIIHPNKKYHGELQRL